MIFSLTSHPEISETFTIYLLNGGIYMETIFYFNYLLNDMMSSESIQIQDITSGIITQK